MRSQSLLRASHSQFSPYLAVLILATGLTTTESIASSEVSLNKPSNQHQLNSQAVLTKLPLFFEPNHGQLAKGVDFAVRTPTLEMHLQDTEAHIWLFDETAQDSAEKLVVKPLGTQAKGSGWQGEEQHSGLSHYYAGSDAKQWLSDIPHYGRIKYNNLYKGIDLAYYGNPSQLEYDFIVAPHADPQQIALGYTGVRAITVTKEGDAHLKIGGQTLIQHRPVAYQLINGKRHTVDAQYIVTDTDEGKQTGLRFKLAAYNPDQALIIDPVLSYASFIGGSKIDMSLSFGLDKQGAMYIAGHTQSAKFPGQISGSLKGSWDVFVSKFDKTGSKLLWTTFLRGNKTDYNYEIAVTNAGKVYLVGSTESGDFPTTTGAYDRALGGSWDAFIAQLATDGKLAYSSYLGGSGDDAAFSLAVNKKGLAYVTGNSYSTDFPLTANAIDRSLSGSVDAFFAKINANGTSLLYSTYLGGAAEDYGNEITIDGKSQAYVLGRTGSADFPTNSSAFDKTYGGNFDAYVSKFNAAGQLSYSTYLGGSDYEVGAAIAVDSKGQAYVAGRTLSADFPTANAFDKTYTGGGDIFITKLQSSGAGLSYSSYLGGSLEDRTFDIAVTKAGEVYIVGSTESADYPLANTWTSTTRGKRDVCITKISADGTNIAHSGVMGGSLDDVAYGVGILGSSAYITGITDSANFPTTAGAYDRTFNGTTDAFLTIVR